MDQEPRYEKMVLQSLLSCCALVPHTTIHFQGSSPIEFHKYFLGTHWVPGTGLGAEDAKESVAWPLALGACS